MGKGKKLKARGKKERKEQEIKKANLRRKRIKKSILLSVIFILFLALAAIKREYKLKYIPVIFWDHDKIMQSSENIRKYTEYLLRFKIPIEYLKERVKSPIHGLYLGDQIDYFVNNTMDEHWRLIQKAEKILKNSNFKIIYIPDKHYDSISGKHNKESYERQQEIPGKVDDLHPKIVFVEGVGMYKITENSLYERINKARSDMGAKLISKQEFLDKLYAGQLWWEHFIGHPTIRLYGADATENNHIWFALNEIGESYGGDREEELSDIASQFNYYWRELLVLSGAVITMQRENLNEAVLVFGLAHQYHLQEHCERMGIEYEIIDME